MGSGSGSLPDHILTHQMMPLSNDELNVHIGLRAANNVAPNDFMGRTQ